MESKFTMQDHMDFAELFKNRIDRRESAKRKKMESRLGKLEKQKSKSEYQKGLILLFKSCLNQDKSYDDTDQQWEDIKNAGKIIYHCKGMAGLSDDYIWTCLPDSIRGTVFLAWDGIGEWLA